ncbi:hypothetical protein ODJ79_10475 [Actinoplanes sp. KI2]|uniref:hypothetical protein n=1 Tax=Actinoplanes sp. KI2 TaxID=2983315 RepID=UPI0021D5BCB4|nr:hypothetical protein [Actinoplanes sp. KI2]MCU7724140.1 hypothetical protein [Actinoplanes sp. KI2]
MRYAAPAALAAMLVVLVAGCGGPQHVSPADGVVSAPTASSPADVTSPSPSASRTPESLPTSRRPSGPPSEPTDNDKTAGWIVGTITAGGTGPCYGLVTDEGVAYALHSTAGIRLDKGTRVRIKGTPAKIRINCGPGRLLEVTAAEPLR